jgi:DNA replication protein DnaC
MPELAPLLKLLRLSGILDSLAARNREAVEGKLAYTEFLALVIQDEVARREQKKFASRVRRAGFRGEKTLEGFDFTLHPQLNQELIRDLATCRFVEEKVSLTARCGRATTCCLPRRRNCWATCMRPEPPTPMSGASRTW